MKKASLMFSLVTMFVAFTWANAQGTLDKNVAVVPQGNFVRIVSIEPDSNMPLHVGDKVDFKVKIEYLLTDPKAAISLVIQKAETDVKNLTDAVIASKTKAVSQGSGTVSLTQTITVVDTETIQVFTPLIVEGEKQTQTVDSRTYEVKKR